ncbi:hypothetical protein VE02_01358 [Pseudogymnoascus sp. 03VT05]|nr:hypothetical protein VE02_01358 [Pseudogymnoascus sp. 03VT05]
MNTKSEKKPEAPEPPRFGRHDLRKMKEEVPPQNKALKKTCDELKKGHDTFVSYYFTKRFNDAMEQIKKCIRDAIEDDKEHPEQDPRKLRKLRDFLEDELADIDQHVTKKRKRMPADEEK